MRHRTVRNAAAGPRRARQRGAALIVGLVMMLALTVLGISGMNMATLELTMAGNTQSQQLAFQAAETGIDLAIAEPSVPSGVPFEVDEAFDADDTYHARATRTFIDPPQPLVSGFSTSDFSAYHFDIVSVGTGPRNAVSTHNQSYYVIGPSVE